MSLMRDAIGVLLAGGQGERLWPLTRDRAKPAVPFGGVVLSLLMLVVAFALLFRRDFSYLSTWMAAIADKSEASPGRIRSIVGERKADYQSAAGCHPAPQRYILGA